MDAADGCKPADLSRNPGSKVGAGTHEGRIKP